mgnify:CR=1 FL=1
MNVRVAGLLLILIIFSVGLTVANNMTVNKDDVSSLKKYLVNIEDSLNTNSLLLYSILVVLIVTTSMTIFMLLTQLKGLNIEKFVSLNDEIKQELKSIRKEICNVNETLNKLTSSKEALETMAQRQFQPTSEQSQSVGPNLLESKSEEVRESYEVRKKGLRSGPIRGPPPY